MNGQQLRALRKRHQWTQTQLAVILTEALGESYVDTQVGRWERGQRKIPPKAESFLDGLALEGGMPGEQQIEPEPGTDDRAADSAPAGDTPPQPQPALTGTGGVYTKACMELWQLIGSSVAMIGAVLGSQTLVLDGQIVAADADALGAAWGKLAETNETFRTMLVGMTQGGAWLEVSMVTGITCGKLVQNHYQARAADDTEQKPGSDGQPDYAAAPAA